MAKKIAIIGAGLGALSAALRLSEMDVEIDVYEAGNSPGGKAGEINNSGYRFDTGPSLLTMPFVLEDLFNSINENIADHLTIKSPEILCKYFYPDDTVINTWSNTAKLIDELSAKTGENADTISKYFQYSKRIYNLTAELFLFNGFTEISNLVNKKALTTLLNITDIDSLRTMHKANSGFFSSPKLIQLFNRYATYNGSSPFKAPATLNIIQYVEYILGGYIIEEGIHALPKTLHKLAEQRGVKFYFYTHVNKIEHLQNKITGLHYTIEGVESYRDYDLVISNSCVTNTYNNLLGDNYSRMAKRYEKLEPSSSALVFYWGINKEFKELETHNILFSSDYKSEFNDIFELKITPKDPTVYIYISKKFNNNDAPKGKENWFVMINAPYNKNQDWNLETAQTRKRITDKINSRLNTDIEKFIEFERVLTPLSIEHNTYSTGGSLYGISSNSKMAAFLRQQNRSGKYSGLYFCGGSAHPGGGIPLVLLSGKIAADLIVKNELKK